MKKLFLFMLVLFIAGLAFADTVVVGTGTQVSRFPLGSYYGYERSAAIYTDTELGSQNTRISEIAWYTNTATSVSVPTKIYLKTTTSTTLTNATWATMIAGATLVYDATHTGTVAGGWNSFVFGNTFDVDDGLGLIVLVERNYGGGGNGTSSGAGVNATEFTGGHLTWNQDNSAPTGSGSVSSIRPNVTITYTTYTATAPPNNAIISSPANGATLVPITTTLNWASGGGLPTGYRLSLGTDYPPTNILNNVDMGLVTTYDPNPDLANGTTYYWKVVAYNGNGNATGTSVWSFTTIPDGFVQIGDGTDVSARLPIFPYYGYSYSQVIYLQSELGNAGLINSLAYYWNGAATNAGSNNWVIYMGHTANGAFASDTDWLPLSSLTQVFAGTVNAPATPGWVTINLPVPFTYNGSSNLVIAVDENSSGYDYPYGQFYCTATTDARGLLYYADSTNPDPQAPPVAMYVRSAIANVLLEVLPIQTGQPAAPILTYPDNGATGLPIEGFDLTWTPDLANGGQPTYYTVYLASTPEDIYNEFLFDVTGTSFNPVTEGGVTFSHDQNWYWTVEAGNAHGSAVVDPPRRFTIISAPPQIYVTPTSLTETLAVGETSTQQLTITNNGGLPLTYSMSFTDTTRRGSAIIPADQMPPLAANPEARLNSETAPFIGPATEAGTRAVFDVQFIYPTHANDGEYGIATDGEYFYTSDWNDAGKMNKYALDGTWLSNFTIAGVSAIRDLAYDGQYFYGAANSTTIYVMDFNTGTLVGTVTSPVSARGITYDPDLDALWVGNGWNADIRCIDRATGTQISALTPAVSSFAGIAYDNLSGTPTLWGNTQNGTFNNQVVQIDISTGAVLQSMYITDTQIPGLATDDSAGGMEIFPNLVHGTASLICNIQNFAFYGLELCEVATWCGASPRQGTVPAGGSVVVDVLFDANEMNPGVYTGNFTISHNAPTAAVNVPVQLTVTGEWPAAFAIDPTAWDYGDTEQLNSVTKQFKITNSGGSVPTPLIIPANGISLSNDAEGNFALTATGLPVTLNHNETYNFTVTFTPQTLGAKTATLNINDNLARALRTVPLSGNGIAEATMIPVNLAATVEANENVILNWAMSTGIPGSPGWLHYDSGENDDGIGTGGASVFDVAMKLDSGTMYNYAGMQITSVKVWPRSANTTYTLRIWTGIDGVMAPTTLAYEQPFTPTVYNAWNEITLNTPFPITGTQAIWVGYNNNVAVVDAATDDYYPAGCDGGPAVVGFGDLISLGTWQSMATAYNLNYNWNIQAYVNNARLLAAPTLLNIPVRETELTREFLAANYPRTSGNPTQPERVLRGFNVYRNSAQINTDLVPTPTYTDYGLTPGTYTYTVEAVYYTTTTTSNPVTVVITPPVPYDLPFVEGWDTSLFDTQQWLTSASNWTIRNEGDPAPSASFGWSPQVTDYTEYLTSWLLNGVGHTNVNVSFELALNNYSMDAQNWMALEVWNGTQWNTVNTWSSFDNNGEGWGFTYYSFDISAYAAGNEFRIRFKAYGEDSYEINYWYIDNINVNSIPTTLAAPVVTISADDPDILLQWEEVPGATWYAVYSSTDPYGTYTYLGYLPSTYIGVYVTAGDYEFFKVTAGAGSLPRGRMLERGIKR